MFQWKSFVVFSLWGCGEWWVWSGVEWIDEWIDVFLLCFVCLFVIVCVWLASLVFVCLFVYSHYEVCVLGAILYIIGFIANDKYYAVTK